MITISVQTDKGTVYVGQIERFDEIECRWLKLENTAMIINVIQKTAAGEIPTMNIVPINSDDMFLDSVRIQTDSIIDIKEVGENGNVMQEYKKAISPLHTVPSKIVH